MKKHTTFAKHLVFTIIVACSAGIANATFFGEYGYGLELDANGVTTLYGLDTGGGSDLIPNGSSVTYDGTSWTGGTESAPALNLGTFTLGVDTLTLVGGSELLYADSANGGYASGGYLNYQVFPGTGSAAVAAAPAWPGGIAIGIDQTSVGGNANNTRVAVEGLNVDLLSGLTPGVYTLRSYGYGYGNSDATTGASTFANNGGGNYGAYFTVQAVPEPATFALAGLGLASLIIFRRRN